MKYYGKIGTSQQIVVSDTADYCPAGDEILMEDGRPSTEHIAHSNGKWILLSEAEQNKKAAAIKKSVLKNEVPVLMLSVLAGGSLKNAQTAYATIINNIPDNVAVYIPEVYPVWSADSVVYKKDDRVTYNGILYKVLTDHTSQASWTPTDAPSLFAKVLTSSESILEWEQPTAENAYMKGDRVRYKGKVYESLIDNNVWAPDAYPDGWKEIEVE